ncbi:hypothetical protein JD276_11410 [Leucobacter sp. CSA1]|uniref:Peptide chain release factor 1 n=1 Tax=Leucobacter chromiisoli TaxID=2796471 RepID=A0A934Q7C9_9MICO|nr:Vms1/Ankzf1 family peptidyl-tRNA hydrolase [Leucobacter chromiisoli]MBK0419640.1 hypothetical protein [Leucobacter chromiisoli]
MLDQHALTDLLSAGEPSTVAYIDGPGARPQVEEEAVEDTVVARLEECGAPEADVDAIKRALPARDGTPSPSARYLLARGGRLELDETFPGARFGPERISFGRVPEIVPLLRQATRSVRYLVVETGREGAEVRLERMDRHEPERVEDVEGRPDSLTKVQAGGWSHARYQRAAEEVWKHNQSEVAEVVDRLVEQQRPDFIMIAGDVRARQMLKDGLGEAASKLVIEHETHTRADGADDEGLERALADAAEQRLRSEIDDTVDRARADGGSAGAQGVPAIVEALQQARVDTLVLDARFLDDDRTLRALDAEPWVAEEEPEGLEAETLEEVRASEALARAALLTGARVLVREEDFDAPDEPREEVGAQEPIASLRWANDAG